MKYKIKTRGKYKRNKSGKSREDLIRKLLSREEAQ